MPGPAKEFFSLHRYQEEVGKDFKRITLYLCTAKDFYHSETANLDWNDAADIDDNTSVDKSQNSAPAKRLKEDPDLICNEECNKLGGSEEIELQIQHDEQVAMELQRQFHDESVCPDEAATHTALTSMEHEPGGRSGYPDTADEEVYVEKHNLNTPSEVVQALGKRVNKEKQFFITVRRRTPLQRILNLWRYESKKQGAHHEMRVQFLGEQGIDSGALTKEFFTEVIPLIGNTLFPRGNPIDSTFHVQNGNFRTSGEIVASSLAQGGPPPCFLDAKAFETLVNSEVDILNLTAEKDLTLSERELIDSIKNDIDGHKDTILEHGFTGLIDIMHIDDIVRSVTVSLVNKRVLYLGEFKKGLALHGLSNIVTNQPKVCQPLFVQGQLQSVDATYLFSLMSPEYSPAGSSRRELEEELMDNFQDFLMALDEGNITGYESAVAWNYNENDPEILESVTEPLNEKFETADLTSAGILGWLTGQKHRQLNGDKLKISAKFDHECLIRNPEHSLCFPLVGACGMQVTFPVSHMKGYDAFSNVFLLAFCKGQAFGNP